MLSFSKASIFKTAVSFLTTFGFNGLSKYSNAVYSLQLLVNEALITHKLILLK